MKEGVMYSPERLRDLELNEFVVKIIRMATGVSDRISEKDKPRNPISVASFNIIQSELKKIFDKAMTEGFSLREIIVKLKPVLKSYEYKTELYEDQFNVTSFLRSCVNVVSGGSESITPVVIRDIKPHVLSSEPVTVNFSLVPPDNRPGPKKNKGRDSGAIFERLKLERRAELVSVLQNDCGFTEGKEYYRIVCNPAVAEKRSATRYRKDEYEAFIIPASKIMFLVCDEGGNSSFVIKRPFIDETELREFLAGKKLDDKNADNPLFYASLRKSNLDQLAKMKVDGQAIVDVIDWDNTEWINIILESVTHSGTEGVLGLHFSEIKKRLIFEKPQIIIDKIRAYIEALSDDDIKHLTAGEIQTKILEDGAVSSAEFEIVSENSVTYVLATIRSSRSLMTKEFAPAEVISKVDRFIEDEVVADKNNLLSARELYQKMLTSEIGVSQTDYNYKSFESRLFRRRMMVPEFAELVERSRKQKEIVREFFNNYSIPALTAIQLVTLYEEYLKYINQDGRAVFGIASKDSIEKRWSLLLKKEGERKQIMDIWLKVETFLSKERPPDSLGRQEIRVWYDKFLVENAISPSDYSFDSFVMKYRRWKNHGFYQTKRITLTE